jgi:hypothetical protein
MITLGNLSDVFIGLHDDEKPTGCYNGSAFLEMDTGAIYLFDAASQEWLATFAPPEEE